MIRPRQRQSRRWATAVFAIAGLAFSGVGAEARTLDLSDPNDVILVEQKLNCSLNEGEPIVYWWQGSAYSRVPGEKDRFLFNAEGMNLRDPMYAYSSDGVG